MTHTSPLRPEVYAIYCGVIDQQSAQKVVAGLTGVSATKTQHLHVLLQSGGGVVSEGIFLYNLFRTLPIEITLYNAGQISSAAVTAYLGGKRRKTSSSATFMIHRSTINPQFATSSKLQHAAKSLDLADAHTDVIIKQHQVT